MNKLRRWGHGWYEYEWRGREWSGGSDRSERREKWGKKLKSISNMKRAARGNVGSCGIRGASDRQRDHFGPTRTIGMWISAQRFNYVSERFVLWNIGASTNIQQPLGRTNRVCTPTPNDWSSECFVLRNRDAHQLLEWINRAAESVCLGWFVFDRSVMLPKGLGALNKVQLEWKHWRHGALTEEETGWWRTVSKELKSKVWQLILLTLCVWTLCPREDWDEGRYWATLIKNEQWITVLLAGNGWPWMYFYLSEDKWYNNNNNNAP